MACGRPGSRRVWAPGQPPPPVTRMRNAHLGGLWEVAEGAHGIPPTPCTGPGCLLPSMGADVDLQHSSYPSLATQGCCPGRVQEAEAGAPRLSPVTLASAGVLTSTGWLKSRSCSEGTLVHSPSGTSGMLPAALLPGLPPTTKLYNLSRIRTRDWPLLQELCCVYIPPRGPASRAQVGVTRQ